VTDLTTSASHTPGPWTIEPFDGSDKEITIREPAVWVDYDDVNHQEQAANARLIVASPELLEVCELIIGSVRIPDDDVSQEVLRRLRLAVRKAKGDA